MVQNKYFQWQNIKLIYLYIENSLVRCVDCKALVPPQNIPSILDAIRLGQDALDKATNLQNSGEILSPRYDIAF
jgi:hypothetical protein